MGWGDGASFPFYNNASSNIRVVGKELSLIANGIKNIFYPNDPENLNIHCIGHSLGLLSKVYYFYSRLNLNYLILLFILKVLIFVAMVAILVKHSIFILIGF